MRRERRARPADPHAGRVALQRKHGESTAEARRQSASPIAHRPLPASADDRRRRAHLRRQRHRIAETRPNPRALASSCRRAHPRHVSPARLRLHRRYRRYFAGVAAVPPVPGSPSIDGGVMSVGTP
ncbi:hypothetical protein DO72_5097 [Burkholderia pseudomallei]|nr:hypothetical protein DO72_5097 [Burkholderia pseudomallei]